jgi:TolA-binding protein
MHLKNLRPDSVEPVAKDVADLISGHVGGDHDARGRDRPPSYYALERALVVSVRRGRRRRLVAGLTSGVVLVAAGFTVRSLVERSHKGDGEGEGLSYTMNALAPQSGELAVQPPSPQAEFSFSDGTRIELAAGARGRVANVGRRGAHFVLDKGKAHVHVVHRPGAEWSFEAGPFAIEVHGTAFSLEWSPERAWLDMRMETGVVEVRGPLSGGRVVLRAGQSLSVGSAGEHAPSAAAPATPAGAPEADPSPAYQAGDLGGSADRPPPVVRRATQLAVGRPRSVAVAAATSNWSHDLDEGRADMIVADAERRGLDRVLRESGSEELSALADAARYKRRYALARQALLAQMRRFPSSSRARDASFFLGRLSEDAQEGWDQALDSYDRYLREAPQGTYASEALARKMVVLERSHREDEARMIATDYLRRYPKGVYAHAALALTRAP